MSQIEKRCVGEIMVRAQRVSPAFELSSLPLILTFHRPTYEPAQVQC